MERKVKAYKVRRVRVSGPNAREKHDIDLGRDPAALHEASQILLEADEGSSPTPFCDILFAVSDTDSEEECGSIDITVTNGELYFTVIVPD